MYQRLAEAPATASGTHGRWDAAPDLERFLCSFYRYFEVKGYRGVLAAHLSHLVALAFTICFSFVLLFFVNWQAVLSCDSEESCRAVLLCYSDPFSQVSLWRSIVLLSFFLFFVYWIFNVVAAYQSVKDAAEISAYYKDRLGIVSDDILATMSWSEVVSRLVEQQKASPFCIVQDELTALEVANIIMREDNFLIAFTNHCIFTSRIPSWIPHRLVHTRSVLQNLRAAVFNYIFDSRSRIRADFLERPAALAQRLRWLGLLNSTRYLLDTSISGDRFDFFL
jgi:autophagy-related protein 9